MFVINFAEALDGGGDVVPVGTLSNSVVEIRMGFGEDEESFVEAAVAGGSPSGGDFFEVSYWEVDICVSFDFVGGCEEGFDFGG